MSLIRTNSAAHETSLAARDILLWTTKDGREIPLDDMSDDHIANAVAIANNTRRAARDANKKRSMESRMACMVDLKLSSPEEIKFPHQEFKRQHSVGLTHPLRLRRSILGAIPFKCRV